MSCLHILYLLPYLLVSFHREAAQEYFNVYPFFQIHAFESIPILHPEKKITKITEDFLITKPYGFVVFLVLILFDFSVPPQCYSLLSLLETLASLSF